MSYNNKSKIIRLLGAVILCFAALTGARAQESGNDSAALAQLRFVQRVSDQRVYARDIVSKMDVNLKVGDKDVTLPGELRMRKDTVIRISINIPVIGSEIGRMELTPSYVLVIDRMHKQYFKADYTEAKFLDAHGLSFYSLQALFWNQLLLPGNKQVGEGDLDKFTARPDKGTVSLTDKGMTYQWTADPASGRIKSAVVSYQDKSGTSTVSFAYDDFQNVGVKWFPKSITMTAATSAKQKVQQATLGLRLDYITTDSNWTSYSTVSPRYQEVVTQDILSKLSKL